MPPPFTGSSRPSTHSPDSTSVFLAEISAATCGIAAAVPLGPRTLIFTAPVVSGFHVPETRWNAVASPPSTTTAHGPPAYRVFPGPGGVAEVVVVVDADSCMLPHPASPSTRTRSARRRTAAG